ncbi:MAG TPA: DUF1634 domain-containing protein [Tepidisphaeraceae bacterium]|nr:DUF1634 domain-containing protein [Tepidisphaeraceae bacterium]
MSDAPVPHPEVAERVRQVEVLISTILRVGVITSLGIVVAGLVLSFVHHREYLHSSAQLGQILTPGHFIPHTFADLLGGLRHFRGESVILLGLLLLIATPVIRVAVSIVIFIHERDWWFVVVTAFVLAMLILSFLLGKAEG